MAECAGRLHAALLRLFVGQDVCANLTAQRISSGKDNPLMDISCRTTIAKLLSEFVCLSLLNYTVCVYYAEAASSLLGCVCLFVCSCGWLVVCLFVMFICYYVCCILCHLMLSVCVIITGCVLSCMLITLFRPPPRSSRRRPARGPRTRNTAHHTPYSIHCTL